MAREALGMVTAVVALVMLAALGSTARAQPTTASQASTAAGALFDKGRQYAAAGKYAEACAAFEQSQRLDPQLGTLFNLATCNAHLGKLATAWGELRDLAQRDTNKARRARAATEAAALAPRLPKLVIQLAPAVPDAIVTSNGVDVGALLGVESPVDLGDYTIIAQAPGYVEARTTAKVVNEGKTVVVAIALRRRSDAPAAPEPAPAALQPAPAAPDPTPTVLEPAAATGPIDESPAAPANQRARLGIAVAGGGGALLVGGVVFGALASSKWNAAKAACGGDVECADTASLARAQAATRAARVRGDVSTAMFAAGAVAAGAGAYLWLRAPASPSSMSARLVPHAGPDSAGAVLEGRF